MITKARDIIASYYVEEQVTVEYTNTISSFAGCETTDGWNVYQTTAVTDSANKYAGTNCIKITGQSGSFWRSLSGGDYPNKYLLLSAYVKNNDLTTGMRLRINNFANVPSSDYSTATTWTRIGLLLQPSDITGAIGAGSFDLLVWIDGSSSSQYGFVDNLMLNEITSDDYAAGVASCLTKYPWKA